MEKIQFNVDTVSRFYTDVITGHTYQFLNHEMEGGKKLDASH